MKKVLNKHAGILPLEIKKLNGYENENFLVTTATNKIVFKTYLFSKEIYIQNKAESEALEFLNQNQQEQIPKPISFLDGSYVKVIMLHGVNKVCRILSYIEGEFWGENIALPAFFTSLGVFLANMDKRLISFENGDIKSKVHEWDIQHLNLNRKYLADINDHHKRSVAHYFFNQFDDKVVPAASSLRKSVIHNDANEWNVLFDKNKVSGVIDFGDISYSFLINEVATAMVYACYDKQNGLENAIPVLKGYHSVFPINEVELGLLYYLMAAKLCISVCKAANSKKTNPKNKYAQVSEKYAWNMLFYLLSISPTEAENKFRKATEHKTFTPPTIKEGVLTRNKHISNALSLSYKDPVYMESAAFQYMYDVNGNSFLDAYNNIPHVGHCHPKVVRAGQKQMAKLNTNTRYMYDLLPQYAEKLLSKFPKKLNRVFFVNSGSAASDLAIRMAKKHTGQKNIMVMQHGYHGNTQLGIEISDYKFSNKTGPGQHKDIFRVEIPDTYRGRYKKTEDKPGVSYAKDIVEQLKNIKDKVGTFICEPIIGCGGQIPLPEGYLKIVYEAIRTQGGVCISDEVQTGFGRLGDWFWGYEMQEVVPDMVILGKPMGNGHPIGAVVCSESIANSFSNGLEFFSSFGGNPVSCAIGLAVLEVIEDENLQQRAKETGAYYKTLFLNLQEKYNCIGDVRGAGLFLGIEMVSPNGEADANLAQHIKNELRARFILISTDGPFDNVIKTKPPLIFNKKDAFKVVEEFERSINSFSRL